MMMLMFTFFLMFLLNSEFSGVFMYFLMFIYLLFNYSLLWVDSAKGDLWGMLGLDYISFSMVLLLLWIISLVMILFYSRLLFFFLMMLLLSMFMMFSSLDFLYLFIYFEFSMIPMLLMILFMGSSKERYLAGMYMFIYTVMSSLPMLMVLLMIYSSIGVAYLDYYMFNLFSIDSWIQVIIMLLFLVKVPMVLVHIWLPKAHVEAPVFGSMILASIMLKMGGYGIIRCMDFFELSFFVTDFFFCFCVCGSFLISYSCLYQVDLKILVAYSSVIHMGIMLMGFFSGTELGYLGGIIMMLSHGVCSSGMFYLVNEIYKVSGSRLLFLNKGCMTVMPVLVWLWLMLLVNNLGIPPCFSILGELMLMAGCFSYSFYIYVYFFFIILFISCFVINMFVSMVNGTFSFFFSGPIMIYSYYGAFMHLLPLNGAIFFLNNFF